MTLKEYFQSPGSLNQEELAARIGKSRSVVSHYTTGYRMPPLDVANKIVAITNGQVTHDDLELGRKPRRDLRPSRRKAYG